MKMPANKTVELLYEDNHILVVNKPAGMLTQGDQTGDLDLLTYLKKYLKEKYNKPGKVFLGLVHRLDRPVSGLLVFARTSKAASRLGVQFRKRLIEKRYMAVLTRIPNEEGTLVDFLHKSHKRVRVVKSSHPDAMRAELSFRKVGQISRRALVDIRLKTGRPHQIRVQFSHIGCPILGDFKYGARDVFDGKNLALHNYHLAFEHPVKKKKVGWSQAPPGTWNPHFPELTQKLVQEAVIP